MSGFICPSVDVRRPRPLALLGVAALLIVIGPAPARAQGFYLGASAAWLDPGNGLSELGDAGFHVVAGYEAGGLAGVEIGYLDWSGPVRHDDPYVREDLELEAVSVAAVGRLALERGITPYAKVGCLFWDADGVVATDDTFIPMQFEYSRSGEDLFLAVGVAVRMGRGVTAFSELAMYEVDDGVIHSAGLGLRVQL